MDSTDIQNVNKFNSVNNVNNNYISLSKDELYVIMLMLNHRLNQKEITPGKAQIHARIFGEIPLSKVQMIRVIKANLRSHSDPIISPKDFEKHILQLNGVTN